MEDLLILLAIVMALTPIVVIVLIVGYYRLRFRLDALEKSLGELTVARIKEQSPVKPVESKITTVPETAENAPQKETFQPDDAKTAKPTEAAPPPLPEKAPATPTTEVAKTASARATPFFRWIQQNWFYVASALSLALAGIFLVQYGMENGLLPPRARVLAALLFGAALIGAGEFIRRRFGDDAENVAAYLPSVFSGAGIVTLFAAVLSARMLYDLIGGGVAMSGMVVIAAGAMFLGWRYGPLLAAVGVIGAFAAPVVLGSSNSDASPLFGYYALVTAMGLGVDTIRRWAWVSVLTMGLAFLMGLMLLFASDARVMFAAVSYFAVLPMLAVLIPARSVSPDHTGGMVSEWVWAILRRKDRAKVGFPTLLAFFSTFVGAFLVMLFTQEGEIIGWISAIYLVALASLLTLWSRSARALQDVAALAGLAVLGSAYTQGAGWGDIYEAFHTVPQPDSTGRVPFEVDVWSPAILVGMAAWLSVLFAWRSLQNGRHTLAWAVGASVFAPAMAILLEMLWRPTEVISPYAWALHAAGLAALMALMAERFARRDGEDLLRTSFALIAALASMAFAFVILFATTALTLALGVVVLAAVVLDKRWSLPILQYFVAAGVVTIGYRLVVDPGLWFAENGPIGEVILTYGGSLAIFVAGLRLLKGLQRPTATLMLDSAAWSTGGMLISVLLLRWIETFDTHNTVDSHWSLGLMASIWLGLALAQLQRMTAGGLIWFVRGGLAVVFMVIGLFALIAALTLSNPLTASWSPELVIGPPVFNTLAAAYLAPALVLLAGYWRLTEIPPKLRQVIGGFGVALAGFWLVLVVRHFWQGAEGMASTNGVTQPELYSYTIMLLVLGGGLFYQSLARGHKPMRLVGLTVIGLAVAKVFLIDITGLEGLTRVFSLLVLGLSLAGLAWLNRWAQEQETEGNTET